MPNGYDKLKAKIADRDEAIAGAQERIQDRLEYFHSSKFHLDTTVQVGEVTNLLVELRLILGA